MRHSCMRAVLCLPMVVIAGTPQAVGADAENRIRKAKEWIAVAHKGIGGEKAKLESSAKAYNALLDERREVRKEGEQAVRRKADAYESAKSAHERVMVKLCGAAWRSGCPHWDINGLAAAPYAANVTKALDALNAEKQKAQRADDEVTARIEAQANNYKIMKSSVKSWQEYLARGEKKLAAASNALKKERAVAAREEAERKAEEESQARERLAIENRIREIDEAIAKREAVLRAEAEQRKAAEAEQKKADKLARAMTIDKFEVVESRDLQDAAPPVGPPPSAAGKKPGGVITGNLSELSNEIGMEYSLTKEDVAFLGKVAKKDEFLKKMTTEVSGLNALFTVLSVTTPGPLKIAVKWNQGAIKGYKTANDRLGRIGRNVICEDIYLHSTDTPNRDFFTRLAEARGC
jgi:hypothetical protein